MLTNSKKNILYFIVMSIFVEVVLATVLFIMGDKIREIYYIPNITTTSLVIFIFLAILFSLLYTSIALNFKPVRLPAFYLRHNFLFFLVILNLLFSSIVSSQFNIDSRYVEGSLTSNSAVFYFLRNGFIFALSVLLIINAKDVSYSVFFLHVLAIGLTVDGLSVALNFFIFVLLFLRAKGVSIYRRGYLVLFVVLGSVFFLFGITKKIGNEGARTLNFYSETLPSWGVHRFSVNAISLYQFIGGESYFSYQNDNQLGYYELILKSNINRLSIVSSGGYNKTYPRNVSEAIAYDFTGEYGSGSSPGVLFGSIIGFPIAFFLHLLIFYLIYMFMTRVGFKLNFLDLGLLTYFFKALTANVSEYLILISPTSLVLFLFVFILMIKIRKKKPLRRKLYDVYL